VSRASLIALCLVLSFIVVANVNCMKCGESVSKKIAEKAMEGAVKAASGGKADISTGGNVDLSGLPASLHYPGAVAKARWSMGGEGGSGTMYTFETPDPVANVVSFYKTALAGWKNASTMETGDATILVYGTEDEKQTASVTVAKDKDSGKTTLGLLYVKKD
jgi:hypothetical protein